MWCDWLTDQGHRLLELLLQPTKMICKRGLLYVVSKESCYVLKRFYIFLNGLKCPYISGEKILTLFKFQCWICFPRHFPTPGSTASVSSLLLPNAGLIKQTVFTIFLFLRDIQFAKKCNFCWAGEIFILCISGRIIPFKHSNLKVWTIISNFTHFYWVQFGHFKPFKKI